ncbi:purine and uridine phosphorylase, partial [Aureobasidium melanogenum]
MEHRTYLWVHLAIDDIRATLRDSFRPDEESIGSMPSSVEGTHEKILARVTKAQHQKVKLIYQIFIGARRPLAVGEMALALGLATSKQHRTSKIAQIDPVHLGKQLRHCCGLFVFANQSRIYLIHQTAREFLIARQDHAYPKSRTHDTWGHCVQQADMERVMTSICMRYLHLEDREAPSSDELSTEPSVVGECQREFIEYCCQWWATYYSLSQDVGEKDTFQDALALYDTGGKASKFWFDRFWDMTRQHDDAKSMTPIRLAALSNHNRVAEYFLHKLGVDVEAKDETGRTALYWAVELGHGEIVPMMLEEGSNFEVQGGFCGNALQAASYGGHDKIVHMLLGRGANVNAQGGHYGNALQAASAGGHDKIVQLLLDTGANFNIQGGTFGNALQAASARGHDEIVQMLLNSGGRLTARAMFSVLRKNLTTTIRLLLPYVTESVVLGKDTDYGRTLLHRAAELGRRDLTTRCLDLGAEVDATDKYGETALHYAAENEHLDIVQILVQANADRTILDSHGRTALECARGAGPREGRRSYPDIVVYLQQ